MWKFSVHFLEAFSHKRLRVSGDFLKKVIYFWFQEIEVLPSQTTNTRPSSQRIQNNYHTSLSWSLIKKCTYWRAYSQSEYALIFLHKKIKSKAKHHNTLIHGKDINSRTKKHPDFTQSVFIKKFFEKLLFKLNWSSSFLKLLLSFFSIFFLNFLFDNFRSSVNHIFSLF